MWLVNVHAYRSFYEREKKLLQFKSKDIMCAITCNHTHTLFSPDAQYIIMSIRAFFSDKLKEKYEINEASLLVLSQSLEKEINCKRMYICVAKTTKEKHFSIKSVIGRYG